MDHKGIVKAGRLSPVIFGNFPIKNALARLGGEMFIRDAALDGYLLDAQAADHHDVPAQASASVVTNEWVLTGGGTEDDEAYLSVNPVDLDLSKGERFAFQASLNFADTDANVAIFAGIHTGGAAAALGNYDSSGPVLIVPEVLSVGIFLKAAEDSSGVTDSKDVFLAKHDGTTLTLVDTGASLVAGVAKTVGLIGDGSGRVQVVVGNSVVKKVSIPFALPSDAVASVILKNQAADTGTLTLGRLLAVAVSD
tara:strand:+ start:4992 stop:5747 length:756 start_codon:yes stop_codon:yes gene_type:complete